MEDCIRENFEIYSRNAASFNKPKLLIDRKSKKKLNSNGSSFKIHSLICFEIKYSNVLARPFSVLNKITTTLWTQFWFSKNAKLHKLFFFPTLDRSWIQRSVFHSKRSTVITIPYNSDYRFMFSTNFSSKGRLVLKKHL